MRPVLLKSAGIVGLAGAIMAVVSGNTLFVDPGGPSRDGVASVPIVEAAPEPAIVIPPAVETGAPTEITEPAEVAAGPAEIAEGEEVAEPTGIILLPAVEVAAPTEIAEPAAIAALTEVVAEAEPATPRAELATTEEAPVALPVSSPMRAEEVEASPSLGSVALMAEGASPEAAEPTPPLQPVAMIPSSEPVVLPPKVAVAPPVREETAVAPSEPAVEATAPPTASVETVPPSAEEADREEYTASLWPKEAVSCPRDWVAVFGPDRLRGSSLIDCRGGAPVVSPAPAADTALDKALPERVLEMTELAPAIPVPADLNAEPEPAPRPKPVRVSRRNSNWPAEPPPNCGDKHAYWHFVDRKARTKEWYCK